MPSANRFALVRETVRNHPVIVASWAATAGILLGGFVTLKVMAPEPRAEKIGTTHAAIETKAAPKPVAETIGSAPSAESAASTDCDKQTWPYLSSACMEAMRGKNRGSAGDLDGHARPFDDQCNRVAADTGGTSGANQAVEPTPSPPAVASTPPAAPVTPATAEAIPAPATPAPAAAAPESSGTVIGTAQAEEKPSPPADQKEAKQEKHERVAKKAKRKPKFDPKAVPKAHGQGPVG